MSPSPVAQLESVLWPLDVLGEAVAALVTRCGFTQTARHVDPPATCDPDRLQHWVDGWARVLGVEAEPTELRYDRLHLSLVRRAPLVLRIERDGKPRFVCVVAAGRYTVRLLTPDRRIQTVRARALVAMLRATLEESASLAGIERLISDTGITPAQQRRLRTTYLRQAVGNQVAVDGWSIRPAPGSSFWRQLRIAGVPATAAAFLATQAAEYSAWVVAWWVLGRALFDGQIDAWLLAGWSLLLGTLVMVRARSQRLQASLAIGVGALLKKRLLDGVLRLEPDETRGYGVGQLLGRTIESESVEVLALAGGFASMAAVVQLIVAGVVIATTTGGVLMLVWLAVWLSVSVIVAWMLARQRGRWVDARLEITHDLVESMVGYRTRLAQEAPHRWHSREDRSVATYAEESQAMDRATAALLVLPRGWLLTGITGLLLTTDSARGSSGVALAAAIGAVLLSYGALRQLSVGLTSVIDAWIAWRRVRVLFRASSRPVAAPSRSAHADESRDAVDANGSAEAPRAVMEARGMSYRYQRSPEPVLRECDLTICRGDRILLEGPSGAGKSTLASLLAGLRQPQAGALLAGGFDHAALGAHAWRRRVVVAPQFHENHVLADTFLFNLLMGRRWPPTSQDVGVAVQVCRELGLGPLLDRMPGGVHQIVGDTGWQLSHGERSRLFVARALLQGADIVIFDESFAALDPETLRECLTCVLKRAPVTFLIAHP
jgi:ATP-binding cassette subfamily B protein